MIARLFLGFLAALLLSLSAQFASPALARPDTEHPAQSVAPGERCDPNSTYFHQTGHTLSRAFRDFWQANGGIPIFGYALTEPFFEAGREDGLTRMVQYFERARFESVPEVVDPSGVQLGLLGRWAARSAVSQPIAPFPDGDDRRYFPETGHSLSYGFKYYWEHNGGLKVLGYPITEEITEGGYTVQYFERARFEYHSEYAGTPYEVLLGRLGARVVESKGWSLTWDYREPVVFDVEVQPQSTRQGGTIAVRACASEGLSPAISFGGRSFGMGRVGSYYAGLVGVDAWGATGIRPVTVTFPSATGAKQVSASVTVAGVDFPRQYLVVPPDRAGLLDPEVVLAELRKVNPAYETFSPRQLWSGPFITPVLGTITTEFAEGRSYNGGPVNSYHGALDIAAPEGTPIKSDAAGVVVLAEALNVRGNVVFVDHGLGLVSAYYHLSRIDVRPGQRVEKGQVVGAVGNTGLSTGAHLHWEIRIANVPVNPADWTAGRILTSW